MIEIVFSDSACGGLKAAQHYGEGKYQNDGIGIIISHADGSKPTAHLIGRYFKMKTLRFAQC